MKTTLAVKTRQSRQDDVGYIVQTWGRSMREEYPDMRTRDFAGWIRDHLNALLAKPGSWLVIAHPPTEESIIWGWAFGAGTTLHYAYVRDAYRRGDVFRRMVGAVGGILDGLTVSHLTATGRELKRRFEWRYVPPE